MNFVDWKMAFCVSGLVHALGLSSLLAVAPTVSRRLLLQQGQTAISEIQINASIAVVETGPPFTVPHAVESPADTQDDIATLANPTVKPQELPDRHVTTTSENVEALMPMNDASNVSSIRKIIPKQEGRIDDRSLEIRKPDKLERVQPPSPSLANYNVVIPDVRHAGVDERPKRIPLKSNEPPKYPLFELQNGIEGRVVVRLSVDSSGHVSTVEIEESSGFHALDMAAMNAVKQWMFEPTEFASTMEPEVLRAPIVFRIRP